MFKRKLMEVRTEWPKEMGRPVSNVKRYVYFTSEPLLWWKLHRDVVIVQDLWFTGGTRTLVWIQG